MFLFQDIPEKIEEARLRVLAENQQKIENFIENMIEGIRRNKSAIEAAVIAEALANDVRYAKVLVASCDADLISDQIKDLIGKKLEKALITDGEFVIFYLWSEATISSQAYIQLVKPSTSNVLLAFKLK